MVTSLSLGRAPALGALLAFLGACGPPATARCANNADCRERTPEAPLCSESICVECVSNTSCEEDAVCDGGRCVADYQ